MIPPRENLIVEVTKMVNEYHEGANLKPHLKKDYCLFSFFNADEKKLILLAQSIRRYFNRKYCKKQLYLWIDDKPTENGIVSELKFCQILL